MPLTAAGRRRLSEAMKARWAQRREDEEAEQAAAVVEPPLGRLYEAAINLVDYDELREAVIDGVDTETLVHALASESSAGTQLQVKLRKRLTEKILEALDERRSED